VELAPARFKVRPEPITGSLPAATKIVKAVEANEPPDNARVYVSMKEIALFKVRAVLMYTALLAGGVGKIASTVVFPILPGMTPLQLFESPQLRVPESFVQVL
jgi:hypothetical protein